MMMMTMMMMMMVTCDSELRHLISSTSLLHPWGKHSTKPQDDENKDDYIDDQDDNEDDYVDNYFDNVKKHLPTKEADPIPEVRISVGKSSAP